MKRTLAILFVAAIVGGLATHSALQFKQRIDIARTQLEAVTDLASASHGVGVLPADPLDVTPVQQAAQSSLAVMQGAQ